MCRPDVQIEKCRDVDKSDPAVASVVPLSFQISLRCALSFQLETVNSARRGLSHSQLWSSSLNLPANLLG